MTHGLAPSEIPLHSVLTLDPLFEFWEETLVSQCPNMAKVYSHIREKMAQYPELQGEISNAETLRDHVDLMRPLMGVIFPRASFDTDLMAVFPPCGYDAFYATPRFQHLFMDDHQSFKTDVQDLLQSREYQKQLSLYFLVLERIYDIQCQDITLLKVETIKDKETGLDRYYRVCPDFKFVHVSPLKPPRELSDADREQILDHLTDLESLARYVDLEAFEFKGFTILRAVDVTEHHLISKLEREMLNQESIFSSKGIISLEQQLRILFNHPDLYLGICALRQDQIMIIKNDCHTNVTCLFTNSRHIPIEECQGSVWDKAARGDRVVRINDLSAIADPAPMDILAAETGIRSIMMAPLSFKGEAIGLIEVYSKSVGDFGAMGVVKMQQIIPIFSVALKRGMDELDKQIQSVIKEKCTAVHPSVEWRFEAAAMDHMERFHQGDEQEMEPIIFKDVVPFYGQSDVRGSSQARNQGIQQDLLHQLKLADDVLDTAVKVRPWPLLQE
ncbi:MAG: GAF domain-containing protein, partial [Desulfobacterales bacterium]|nr:GAF domain-containing protein [Desulfobacterales bacterium]